MDSESWTDVGAADVLSQRTVQEVLIDHIRIALTFADGQFGAISGICNHVGGPLGAGFGFGHLGGRVSPSDR